LPEITPVGLDRPQGRLSPEQHVRVGAFVALDRKCASYVNQCLSLGSKPIESFRDALTVPNRPSHLGSERGMRLVELEPAHRLESAFIAHVFGLIACKIECISNAGETARIRNGSGSPFPTGIGECHQVPGEIPAVDG
jgi:hypothetical protein